MIPCQGCQKGLYPLERMTLNAKVYHKTGCAKCSKCRTNLTPHNFAQMGEVMLCKPHYMQAFSESGGSYNMPSSVSSPRNRPLPPIPTKPAAVTKLLPPPPIPQSMLNKQPKALNRLSAFLTQHSTPEPVSPAPEPYQRPLPPPPREETSNQSSPSSSKLTAFLGKNTTSLKDIRIAAPPPRSTRPPASLLMRERMSAFTSSPAATNIPSSRPISTPGVSLKDRLRAYTSAAASSSNQARQSPAATTTMTTPMAQRLQTYRQAANASSSQVPTAIVVNDENSSQVNTTTQNEEAVAWTAMREICSKARQQLEHQVHPMGVKQEQAYNELTNELTRWVTRLDRFAE